LVNSLSWTVLTQLLVCAADSVLLIIDGQERLAAAMNLMVRANVLRNVRFLLKVATRLAIATLVTEQYLSLATIRSARK